MEKAAAAATTQGSVPLTTFVQADTSTFRELVQKLTGATDAEDFRTTPSTSADAVEASVHQTTTAPIPKPMGVKKPTFKLHERRQCSKPKLEIVKPSLQQLKAGQLLPPSPSPPPTAFQEAGAGFSSSLPSTPGYITSPLQSPSTSFSNLSILEDSSGLKLNSEEEERAIKERRFYLHPSPRSRAGGGGEDIKPELLPLFPLTSPTNHP